MKTTITVRVEPELKDEIERNAQEEGLSPSEYTRNILCEYLDFYEDDDETEIVHMGTVYLGESSNIKKELPQLALLLFVLLANSGYCTRTNVNTAKGFLENLTKNQKLSNELRFELVKVLNNINLLLVEGINYSGLHFIQQGNMYSLNYSLLFSEVYNLIGSDYEPEK